MENEKVLLEEAEKAYRSTIKFDPKNIEAYLEIAASLFERKQYVKAEDAYRNKTILDPENSNAYLGIAECLYELKEYEKALSMYNFMSSFVFASAKVSRNVFTLMSTKVSMSSTVARRVE